MRLTRKGRETRERILGVAAELIHERGVAGIGLDDIRRAAAVSGSQLTHYFHDKRTLLDDVIARQAEETLAFHRRSPLDGMTTLAAWDRWADAVVEKQAARDFRGGCDFGSLAGQLAETGHRAALAAGFERLLALFRDGVRTMRETGELRADADPDVLASALLGALQGGLLLAQTLRRPEPLRDSLAGAVGHLRTFAVPG